MTFRSKTHRNGLSHPDTAQTTSPPSSNKSAIAILYAVCSTGHPQTTALLSGQFTGTPPRRPSVSRGRMWWKKHRDHSRGGEPRTQTSCPQVSLGLPGSRHGEGGHTSLAETRPPRLGSDFCTVIERMITTPTAVPDNSRGSNHRPEQLFNEVTPTIDGIPSAGDAPDRSFSVVWSFFSTPFRLSPARRPRISPEPADSPHCHSTAVHFSRGAQIFNRPRQPRAKTASQQPAVSFPAHPVV